ncbi:MAG: 50S ribosomal protein L33 [Synergistetes bacterium]|nr:50S ribosomal protein L33 [Synergistota bacterium]MCX8127927.1 50S ribosomal protein L33 [Synergistota bacterium]MDW8192189.1 50S ribosomal protein L33 [Synergistota bacterium]
MADILTLACSECKRRNYTVLMNRKGKQGRFETRKYCRWCNKHTLHREVK